MRIRTGAGAVRSGRFQGAGAAVRSRAGEKVRQLLDGAGQVVQPAVRITRRQVRRRVSGQFLQGPQVDAGASAQRQVGMPQSVEVGVQRAVRSLDAVRDASGVEVNPQHLGALASARPRPAPDGPAGRLAVEVAAQQIGHVRRQRLHFQHAAFVPPRRQRDGRRLGVEVEGFRRQTRQGRRAKAGPAGGGVQVETIRAAQTAKRPFARPGRRQQTGQFFLRQFPPVVAPIRPVVTRFQVRQGIVGRAMVLDQPATERLDVRQVLIRCLDARPASKTLLQRLDGRAREAPGLAGAGGVEAVAFHGGADGGGLDAKKGAGLSRREPFLAGVRLGRRPVAAQLGEKVHDARRRHVGQEHEPATVDQRGQPRADDGDVPGIIAPRPQVAEIVGQVFTQRPLAVRLEGIDNAGFAQLGPLDQLGQHLLGGGLVRGQRHATDHAVGAGILAVPLAGVQAHALAVLRQLGLTRLVLAVDPTDERLALAGEPLGALRDGFGEGDFPQVGHGRFPF
ncbi:MAG TPA: hypothetical protein VH575_28320 [Gemmataceae bacterium]